MSTVETVLGPVKASKLGFTLSHEHVFTSAGRDAQAYPWLFDWKASRKVAVGLLKDAKKAGVDSIIDLTTPDLGRDVRYVRRVARTSPVHVIVATGLWADVPRSFHDRDPDEAADIFVREIEVGIEDTGIKAGVIKLAHDVGGVKPHHERSVRGAARACKRTGCPISTHHWAPEEVGRQQVKIFQEEGAQMDRVCIGHSADSTNIEYLEWLLNQGVYLSMDRYPGREGRPNWEQRNATVKALVDRGWAGRLMLGHDFAPRLVRVDGKQPPYFEGQAMNYTFLSTTAIPALRAAGVSEEAVDTMTREVPRRFLTGES
jgi:phosphotriesterase-related protein